MRLCYTLILTLVLVGCGYRPSSKFAHDVVGDKVSTEIKISMVDPENTVIIKDALNSAVITRFKSSLVDKSHADTHLDIKLRRVNFVPLKYDANGYIIAYRTKIVLDILRTSSTLVKRYNVKGVYDFKIEPNAIISDQARFNAIEQSASKALESFIARIAAEGVHKNEKERE